MNTKTITAQNCSLFEIDAELEEAFDQLQEEREITGTISNESRERCTQLFAELGKKIDHIAAYLRTQRRRRDLCVLGFRSLEKLSQALVKGIMAATHFVYVVVLFCRTWFHVGYAKALLRVRLTFAPS